MHVITYKAIREFVKDHPDAEIKLGRWYKWMKKGRYNNFNELKRKFSGVDYIGNDRYVFNISGKNYRLVAMINFKAHRAYIRYIGNHADYDKIDCSKI
jgi:mRNA interferase HigB